MIRDPIENFTTHAKRSIFFARVEAGLLGSSYIEPEHLLVGLLREGRELLHRFIREEACEQIKSEIGANWTPGMKFPASADLHSDLPLSPKAKRVLTLGAEEAVRARSPRIGCEHILLGIWGEGRSEER